MRFSVKPMLTGMAGPGGTPVTLNDDTAVQTAFTQFTLVAEIHVKIFDLGGPIIGEGPLDAAAGGPAGLGVAGGRAVEIRLHIGEGAACGGVEQDTIGGVAGAAARCRQPIVAGLAIAAEGADAGGGAGIDCGIIPIAFDAKHKGTGLEIGAKRTADHAAIIMHRAGRSQKPSDGVCRPFGIAPAPATIDANIYADPAVNPQHHTNG